VTEKNFGKTVLGWFVVQEDEHGNPVESEDLKEPEPSPAAKRRAGVPPLTRPLDASDNRGVAPKARADATPRPPGPDPAASRVSAGGLSRVPEPGGIPNFSAVYGAAGISPEECERVQRAISLVESLPKETPRETKRQIVEASLKAFGLPVDEIIEAGVQEIQALEAFIQRGAGELESALEQATTRIEQLTNQIAEIHKLMEERTQMQQRLTRSSNEEKLRVQSVLEFFGQERIAQIVKQSPKLIEPE
jgi:hypothetical protein